MTISIRPNTFGAFADVVVATQHQRHKLRRTIPENVESDSFFSNRNTNFDESMRVRADYAAAVLQEFAQGCQSANPGDDQCWFEHHAETIVGKFE